MTEEDKLRLFENFLSNGMDISPFRFFEEEDKENLFTMVQEYLVAMTEKVVSITYNYRKDMAIHIDDRLICIFMIDSDYRTLTVDTDLPTTDEDLQLSLTMLFLTIKELSAMINALSKAFDTASSREDKYTKKESNKKFVPTSTLPKNIMNNIEKIKNLQKSILSENEKYKISRKKKKDDE